MGIAFLLVLKFLLFHWFIANLTVSVSNPGIIIRNI